MFLEKGGKDMNINEVVKAVKTAAAVLGAVATLLVSVAEAVTDNG